MSRRPPVILTPGHGRGHNPITHPNDQDLNLDVPHAAGASVRVQTDESAYPGGRISDTLSRVTLPAQALGDRIGRMDLELEVAGRATPLVLDLLARPEQAEDVRELVASLVRTPLALLAMPRTRSALEPDGDGERDRVENLKEASRLYSEAAQLLAANPPTRVSETEAETPPGARLTAAILHALTHQPYALQPATPGAHTLPIRGRHYTAGGVTAPLPTEDTDTPANRFAHGVGLALERLAHETLAELRGEQHALADHAAPIDGYVSIRQLTRTQAASAARARIQALEEVIGDVRLARARLEKRLPVRAPNRSLTTSPRVLLDPRYARVRRTLDLLRAPATTNYGTEGLVAGITNLTTLYELYCLASLHDLLQEKGWSLTRLTHNPTSGPAGAPHVLHDGQEFPNTFTYQHAKHGEATLLYEPRITRDPHPLAGLVCISAFTHNLTPDIVIRSPRGIVVLDAKFRHTPPRELMADAALKYLHGLQPADDSRALVGLHLLHYGADAIPLDFHDRVVTPSISTIPVHPNNRAHLGVILDRYLAT